VRDLIDPDDLASAYAVQRHVTELQEISGARAVGRKIGLTSLAVQRQLGVDQSSFGTLLDTMRVENGSAVSIRRLLQPKIEAEIMLVLGSDLEGTDVGPDEARAAVSGVGAALEITDSRIIDWDITIVDTVADNASSGLFVPSAIQPLDDTDLPSLKMKLRRGRSVISSGSGAQSRLGDPLLALAWLARETSKYGVPLRAGEVIITGALGPMVPIRESGSFSATVGNLPPVSVQLRSSTAMTDRDSESAS
jgi:2-keto-4-pentenoate hydratase